MVKRKVVRVIDGDTFTVDKPLNGSKYIRIANKNTPERGQRGYKAATIKLEKQIGGKNVDITPVGRSYGRIVAKYKKIR